MTVSSHDRLGNLMRQVTEGLKPFVEMRLKAVYKNDWTAHARAEWRDGALRWEPATLFSTIIEQWTPVFSQSLRVSERNLVYELRDWRNRWAHQESFTNEDAYSAFDNAERLLVSVDSPLATTVKQQKQELLRIIHEETQTRLRQEQANEEREQREREQRQQLLETLLPVYLNDPQGEIIQAIHAVLQRGQGLNKVTEAEVADYFKRLLYKSSGQREVDAIRTQRGQSPRSVLPATPTEGGIEAHGLQRVMEALETAGYQTVLSQRNVLRVQSEAATGRTVSCCIRVISATDESFNIRDRYNSTEIRLLAFVWYARDPLQATIYVMTYDEALAIAEKKRWTLTDSWQKEGYYSTTKPDRTLRDYLKPHAMTPDKWRIVLSREMAGGQ